MVKKNEKERKANVRIAISIGLLVFATTGIDLLFAKFRNSSFYISESLIFSSYWWLYLPLLNIQWVLVKQPRKTLLSVAIIGLFFSVHLFCYPAMVWLLSKSLYTHTFDYWQTFNFGLTAYSITTLIIYTLSSLIMVIYKNQAATHSITIAQNENPVPITTTSMIVSDSNNKKMAIETKDILYFSANSPYVTVHHPDKKYLHSETLKSLEMQLDNHQFIRIHKSCIVNINKVTSYQSRLNGDYDLTLMDDTILRVSRNFAPVFRSVFEARHRLATK